jgi:hypothetical protein
MCLCVLAALSACASDFVPRDFEMPTLLETEHFRVRPIRAADATEDYEAVMESIDIIHARLLSDTWPTEEFTLEENREDLARKERRFDRRRSFTYTVTSLDESKVLGCVYINPGIGGPDAAVFMWVRRSALEEGLDPLLEAAVREWMEEEWPFEWVVYPGRPAPGPAEVTT